MGDILYKRLSDETRGACIEVHKLMGPNLGEKIYAACVQKEFLNRGYHADRQKWIDIFFKGEKLDEQYRIDMLLRTSLFLNLRQCRI